MKKLLTLSIILLILANSGCKKELVESAVKDNSQRFKLEELKSYIKQAQSNDQKTNSIESLGFGIPDWNKVSSLKLKNGNNLLSVSIERNYYDILNRSSSRLVAYKDSLGQIFPAIMRVIPTKEYISKKSGKISLKDFTGEILFFNLNGIYLRGYYLEHGRRIGSLELVPKIDDDKRVDGWSEECKWISSNYYDANGVTIRSVKTCRWKYEPDFHWPEEEEIDWIDNENTGGGYVGEWEDDVSSTREIKKDTSLVNNPKANCAFSKLLGNNATFDDMVQAFKNRGFDLTFKVADIRTPGNDGLRGTTNWDHPNPNHITITLDRQFVNESRLIDIAKTLLHEAFHADLVHYVYNNASRLAPSNWTVSPENMTLEQLIKEVEVRTLNNTQFHQDQHEFMAANIQQIMNGVKEFAQKNFTPSTFSSFDDSYYRAFAFRGLETTKIFHLETDNQTGLWGGHTTPLAQIYIYRYELVAVDTEHTNGCN